MDPSPLSAHVQAAHHAAFLYRRRRLVDLILGPLAPEIFS
jgi:hypothetical protein